MGDKASRPTSISRKYRLVDFDTLEVGKTYITRDGQFVYIINKAERSFYPFVGDNHHSYTIYGNIFDSHEHENDLIFLVIFEDEEPSNSMITGLVPPGNTSDITVGGGTKYDDGKPRMDLLEPSFLIGVAEILGHGASKYGDNNWKGGFDWGRLYAAAQRHQNAFWAGEDRDEESGKSHLLHAATNLMFLYWHWENNKGKDTRNERS